MCICIYFKLFLLRHKLCTQAHKSTVKYPCIYHPGQATEHFPFYPLYQKLFWSTVDAIFCLQFLLIQKCCSENSCISLWCEQMHAFLSHYTQERTWDPVYVCMFSQWSCQFSPKCLADKYHQCGGSVVGVHIPIWSFLWDFKVSLDPYIIFIWM